MTRFYNYAWSYYMTWTGVTILILTAAWSGSALLQLLVLPVIVLGISTAVCIAPPLWRQAQLYFIKDWLLSAFILGAKWLIEVLACMICFVWGVLVCGPQYDNQIMGLYMGLRIMIQILWEFV